MIFPPGLYPAVSIALLSQALGRAQQIFLRGYSSGTLALPEPAQPDQGLAVGQHQKIHFLIHIVPLVTQTLSQPRHLNINTTGNYAQGIAEMRNTKSATKTCLFLLFLCLDSKPLSGLSSYVPNQADDLLVSALQTPNPSLFPWDTLHPPCLKQPA